MNRMLDYLSKYYLFFTAGESISDIIIDMLHDLKNLIVGKK